MCQVKHWLIVLASVCGTAMVWGQTDTNRFQLFIKPPANTIMIAETTNAIFLTITNLALTNITVIPDPTGGTNSTTNIDITPLFTNVTVTAAYLTNVLPLLDNGKAPDKTANDGAFSANFIAPVTDFFTNLTLVFTLIGDDLMFTNDTGAQQIVTITNTATTTYKIVARPANDRFTNAFKIEPEGGVILATNNYASLEPGEPQHAKVPTVDASVWWKWSIPNSTNVLIDTAGSSFNPILAVYTGTLLNQLVEVVSATNDVVGHYKAHVNFNAIGGVTYRIAVASPDTNSVGNIRLRVAPGALPDTNGPGVSITSPPDGSLFTTNLVDFSGVAAELNPNESGLAQVYLQINSLKPQLAAGTAAWNSTLSLPAGTNTINAFAVDYAGNTGQVYAITVTYMNPTNDNFSSSILLPGASGAVLAIDGRATKELGEPNHAGNEGGHSIWYAWQAPGDGLLFLTTTNSDFDTLLALYTGDSVTNLTPVASNDDAFRGSKYSELTQFVVSNLVYHIAVDGYGGDTGRVQLHYVFTPQAPPQFYTLTINSSPEGQVTPGTGYYATNSVVSLTATPAPNYIFAQWEGSVSATNNPLSLLMNGNKTLTPRFRFINYTETFESGSFTSLPWTTPSGTIPWVVQTNVVSAGSWAASSGPVGDSQTSGLQLLLNTLAGTAYFDYRVSSEPGWDYLEFYLNGTLLKKWSGEVGWQTYFFDVPAGTNSFAWHYSKDPTFSQGLDAAFLDNVYLPLGSLSPTLAIAQPSGNPVTINVQGKFGQSYFLQASTNLVDWTTITNLQLRAGSGQVVDPGAGNYPIRYYRALAY